MTQGISAGSFVLLQAVFRRAGGLIYDFLLLSCGIRLLMFQPCLDRILICLIRSLIYYNIKLICGSVLFHFGTSGFPRFESAAQTINILSIVQRLLSFLRLTMLTGRVLRRILNDFNFPMALSTWILTCDIFLFSIRVCHL